MNDPLAHLLTRAIEIANQAHWAQFDKCGQPYILHPLRVMLACETTEQKIVAVVHDVLEDGIEKVGDRWLAEFPANITDAIQCLTRKMATTDGVPTSPERYMDSFIERIAKNPLARAVKLADLADNMDPRRVPPDAAGHDSLLKKYRRAKERIEAQIELERLEKNIKKIRDGL